MILVDAGPLVAIVDADDAYHQSCTSALPTLRERLGTVWPVLAEAMHLLRDLPHAQDEVWQMIQRGAIEIFSLAATDVPRIRELMKKYSDLPMDLADAALIRVAERENVRRFFTVDRSDFSVYRLHGRIRPLIVP